MDSNLFKVVYTGQLFDGFATKSVIEQFARKFKLSEVKATQIIQSKKPVVLKPKAEHVKAYKLKSALEAMGLVVKLERVVMQTTKPVSKPVTEDRPVDSVMPNHEDSHSKTEPVVESTTHSNETVLSDDAQPVANSWSLEPMAKDEPAEVDEQPAPEVNAVSETNEPTHHVAESAPVSMKKSTIQRQVAEGRTVGELVKIIGGWVVGILAALFVLVKKFGLFKFLKVGGLMATAAFAGYESEEMCMGNSSCEDAVDDQFDDCWERSGLAGYDWDNMSGDEYLNLKPKIEEDFVACFVYENTGDRVFTSPLDLRFDLIDNCLWTENESCFQLAEAQFKSCYVANEIEYLVSAKTTDFYQAVDDNQKDFKNYYSCFVDESGSPLFDVVLLNWDELYSAD